MAARGRVVIGTSGWSYPHWVGPFYAPGTSSSDFLPAYAQRFTASEVNTTFYQLPAPETLDHWLAQTPAAFIFACKASRYITHVKKLKDPERSTARFFDAIARLGGRLGPVLFQLPPNWRPNPERLAAFLAALPAGYRYVFEFRDPRWFTEAVYARLAEVKAGLVIADMAGETSPVHVTADLVYLRLHGPGETPYTGSYSDAALDDWAEHVRDWNAAGRDVYVFFDNDAGGNAPADALRLKARLDPSSVHGPLA